MRFLTVLILLVVLLSGTIDAQDSTPSVSPESVQLFMTFVPNIQFAPVYAALAKGYFDEQSLAVSTEHGDEPAGVDLIAAGERDFGLISGEQILAARANGRPVVSVYEWFQQYPVGILYPEGTGIESVTDLAGRNVGIPGRFGASYSGLTALLAANGMTEQAIDLEEIGFNAPEVFCVGGVEAAVVYINNEPLQIARRAESGDCGSVSSVGVFRVADAVDLVSNGLVTSEALLEGNPGLVRRMVAAFDAGLRSAIDNPAEVYLLSAPYVEGLPLSPELQAALETASGEQADFLAAHPEADRATLAVQREELLADLRSQFRPEELTQFEVLLASIALWDADQLGLADDPSWSATGDVLLNMGYITDATDTSSAFTNAFLPGQP